MSQKQKRVFWPSLTITILGVIAIAFAFARGKSAAAPVLSEPESTLIAQRAAPEFKQRIRVFVHNGDIRPQVIHAWPGKALVVIENEAQAALSLQIERVLPNRTQSIGEVGIAARSKRLQREVNRRIRVGTGARSSITTATRQAVPVRRATLRTTTAT